MKRFFSVFSIIMICLLTGLAASAAAATTRPMKKSALLESDGSLSVGAGYMDGNTAYRIDIFDPSTGGAIESELKFPLNTVLLNLEAGYVTKDSKARDAWKVTLSYSLDAGGDRGKLQDSDWMNDVVDISLVGAPNPGKDIYSESSVDLNAHILDLRITRSYWLSDSFAIGPLAGYLYEDFNFTVRDLNQVGYGPYQSAYSRSIPGKVLTYDVVYQVPYAGFHSEIPAGRGFRVNFDLGYSPWAKAEDEDDHVLRTKKGKGKTTGSAWLAALGAQWELEDNNFITVKGEYRKIDTTGTQTQYWYGNADAPYAYAGDTIPGIHDRISSEQLSMMLLFTSRF